MTQHSSKVSTVPADIRPCAAASTALLLRVAEHILSAESADGRLAEEVFEMIRTPLEADLLFAYQINAEGSLQLAGVAGLPAELRENAALLHVDEALCGQVVVTRMPLVADENMLAHEPTAALMRQMGMRAYACHPLLGRDGQVFGTFSVASARRTSYPQEDIDFLQTVSHFLALAWVRQDIEDALRAGENRYRLLLDSITDAFFAVDRDWIFTYLNRQAEVLLKRTKQDLVGKCVWQEFQEAIGTELYPAYHRAMAENVTVTLEVFYSPHDCWYDVRAYPSPQGLSVYFRDVTPAKNAERALKEASERLQVAQQAAHIGTFEWDVQSRRVLWAAELEALYGLAPGTFGKSYEQWTAAVHPDDLPEAEACIHEALETGGFEGEWRAVWPDGTIRWLAGRGQVFKDEAGRPLRMVGVNIDITERKRAEEEVRRREQELRMITDHTPEILARYDQELRHVFINRTVEEVAGIPREFFLGKTCQEVGLPADVCEELNSTIRSVFEQGRAKSLEFQFALPLGIRYHTGQFVPEISPTGQIEHVLGVIGNRTAEQVALQQLQEADRRKDEFLATLAHELRNPLAPIRTGLQVLRLAQGRGEVAETALAMMERQVTHMVSLIDDLLDVSRISRGKIELKRERLLLRAVLDSALEASQPFIAAGQHQLTLQLPPEVLYLDADATRLPQVLSNLLNNAAKYTAQGGRIELSARREGSDVVIQVRDNGVGIPPEMLEEVFEMFSQVGRTLDYAQGGLGIGLSIARRLTAMHGGTIEAASAGPGQGATFTVRLPLAESPQAAAPDPGTSTRSTGMHKVLVVDDNIDAAASLALLLDFTGHATRVAHGGIEALAAAREFQPGIVFCDIGMPGMDGYEVARRFRTDPALKRIMLVAVTGWGSDEDKRRAKEAGFDVHLTKPADPALVQKTLQQLRA